MSENELQHVTQRGNSYCFLVKLTLEMRMIIKKGNVATPNSCLFHLSRKPPVRFYSCIVSKPLQRLFNNYTLGNLAAYKGYFKWSQRKKASRLKYSLWNLEISVTSSVKAALLYPLREFFSRRNESNVSLCRVNNALCVWSCKCSLFKLNLRKTKYVHILKLFALPAQTK